MYYLLIMFVLHISYIDGYRFDYQFSQEARVWLKLNRVPATWQNAYLNCRYEEYTLNTKTGSCYKVHRSPLNWTRAFVACAREGGYLAIVNSAEEVKVITSLWESTRARFVPGKYNRDIMFLGFRNFEKHFLWMTIHGQTLADAGYDRWSDGQPDQSLGDQDCGAMFMNGLLDDNNCENILPFVCEKDPDSLLSHKST